MVRNIAKAFGKLIEDFMKSLVTKWLEDLFMFVGIALILFTTYNHFGVTIGNYALGLFLLLFGFVLAKK